MRGRRATTSACCSAGWRSTRWRGDGVGEAEVDHAAHAVRERSVRAHQGGRWAPYPLLQGVSAAVLSADDGRDGDGGAAGGGGDGDAGGQHEDDDRADHADRDGGAAAVCDPRRRPHRRRRRGHQDLEVRRRRCRGKTSSWNAPCAKAGTISRPRTGGSTRSGRSGRSTARAAISTRRTRNRSSDDGRARQPEAELAGPGGGLPARRAHGAQEVVEIKNGKKVTAERKIYPGYVLVNMVLNQETIHVINGIQGVIKFVGTGRLPMPLRPEEVNRLLGIEEAAKEEEPQETIPFLIGQVVEITEGPFSDFSGTVEEVIPDKGKVRVAVSLFGRPTSVELDYLQLKAH